MTAATCGWVTMSMRELDRLKVIEAIIEGRLNLPLRRASAPDDTSGAPAGSALSRGRPSRPNISSTWSAE